MAAVPDVRIDWRGDGFSAITNEAFLTDTTGWSVAAGINAAATSITRTTGDGVLGGVVTNTCAELVTTATSGSGTTYDFGTTTFTVGRVYRFSVWLKSVSGTTSARILVGSLGTAGDRGSSTMTITTSWVRYSVDWTPSGTRTDVEAIVTNNAASAMTARICLAEVYEAIDDIGPAGANEVDGLDWERGANFDGSAEAPGTCTIAVTNIAQRYSPDNSSGALFGLLTTGRPVMVRVISAALVYGGFRGTVRRIIPLPETRTAQLLCEDRLYELARYELSLAASSTRCIRDFRTAILTAAGWTAAQASLSLGSPESHIPITGADQQSALDVLADLNTATGTIHFVKPHPVPSVGAVYTTVDRTLLQTAASSETIDDVTSPGITGLAGYDVNDELTINSQRVAVTTRTVSPLAEVWTADDLPFSVPASTTRYLWVDFADPVFSPVVAYTATNTPTVTLTAFSRSAKIAITAGGTAAYVTALSVNAAAATVYGTGSEVATTGLADKKGATIESEFIEKRATAQGLADYVIVRYGTDQPRPAVSITNRQPTQFLRDIGDTIALTFGLLSISAKRFVIRSTSTAVLTSALEWVTTYDLEAALADTVLFTVGGSADEGIGGSGILAY